MPGAVATEFWELAGKPVEELPSDVVMSADDVVDAALKISASKPAHRYT